MADQLITVVGNATKDPELRYTTSGRGVASFGLAVNRRWQQNGEWQESVTFMNVVAWGDLGEHLAQSISKGNRVIVTGRIEQRDYDDKEGIKRYVFELIADDAGPSLRWATAEVERISRSDDPGPQDPHGNGPAPQQQRQPDPIYGDEEPF